MRALMMQLQADGKREKVLVDNWGDLPPIEADQVRTETLFSGLTNGTERNGLIGGNYSPSDQSLPAGSGYQNVGRVIQVGSEVDELEYLKLCIFTGMEPFVDITEELVQKIIQNNTKPSEAFQETVKASISEFSKFNKRKPNTSELKHLYANVFSSIVIE